MIKYLYRINISLIKIKLNFLKKISDIDITFNNSGNILSKMHPIHNMIHTSKRSESFVGIKRRWMESMGGEDVWVYNGA